MIDSLLTEQVQGSTHYHNSVSPEHRLLWAMLSRAIEDSIGNVGANINEYETPTIIRDAYCWIMYPKWLKDYHLFSFENVCQELEINPLIIRKFVANQNKKPIDQRSYRGRMRNYTKAHNKKGAGRPKQIV